LEREKPYNRKYYLLHREEKIKASVVRMNRWVKENPERRKQHEKAYRIKHRDQIHVKSVDYGLRIKREVIGHYGGKCACCGENCVDFLVLDHKNDDGNAHRKTAGKKCTYGQEGMATPRCSKCSVRIVTSRGGFQEITGFAPIKNNHMAMEDEIRDILRHHEAARNNDVQLAILYWWKHHPGVVVKPTEGGEWRIDCTLDEFVKLPNVDKMKRIRAKIQNDDKMYLPTDQKVLEHRSKFHKNQRSYAEWRLHNV